MFKIFICTFNISNQRLRRYTSGVIYAGSYEKTIFHFNFNTPDWDLATTKTAVFSYRGENHNEPLDENNMCKVPKEVLHEGYFLVSVYGNGVPTNSIRIPVAKAPEDILPDSGDVKSGVVFVPEISENKILSWTNNGGLDNPAPVDLNPFDEWVEDETTSEYIWEEE